MSTRHRWAVACAPIAAVLLLFNSYSPAKPSDVNSHGGSVGLRDLIALALQNDPELVALRLNVPVAEAEKLAAKEWRDPEIRVGISKDDNIQLDPERTERTAIRENIGSSNAISELDGDSTEIVSEQRVTTVEEKITPGEESDHIRRTERQVRSTTTDGPNGRKTEQQTINSISDQTRFHDRDRLARDHTTSIRARFYPPNPWEMKERVRRAEKEVALAKYRITEAERKVILRVRDEYERLQYLHKKMSASHAQAKALKDHLKREADLLEAGGITIDQQDNRDIDLSSLELDIMDAEFELETEKRKLAKRVGLRDGRRIRVTDRLIRSTVDLGSTDLEYLIRMAHVLRGEVGALKHQQRIAEGDLKVIRTKRIPWLSFIEAAYAKDSTGGSKVNDNYGVQFGVTLPLFSWLARDEKVAEARIESYYGTLEASKKSIANEVAESYRAVKSAAAHRSKRNALIATQRSRMDAMKTQLDGSDDLAAREQLRYDIESMQGKHLLHRIKADRLYNQALIALEQSLGADLDHVFSLSYESLDGGKLAADEVSASAAPSGEAKLPPRAKPRPKLIKLKSQKKPEEKRGGDSVKRKRRGGIIGRMRSKAERGFSRARGVNRHP